MTQGVIGDELCVGAPSMQRPSIRVALLTNIIAPYRVPIYNALAQRFSLFLLYSGEEDNRTEWRGIDRQLVVERVKRAAGITVKYFAPRSGDACDDQYLHINPGYLADLVRVRPDAVVSAELGFRTLCALLYCKVAGVPLWVWWEGSVDTERDVGGLRRLVRRLIARHADWWISCGINATIYLRSLGVPAPRIVQAQNCVDEGRFISGPVFRREPGGRPRVLVVSRLVPGKGIRLLLDAAAQLAAEGCEFSLVIVGDGVERQQLEQQAQKLALTNVEFHLRRPPDELPGYYRNADLLVLPTLHDVWGLVVNEALWSGLPVLASKYAGCATELLPPEQIFDPLDRQDFTSKLRNAIDRGLPPVDLSRLMPVQQVASVIGDSIATVTRANGVDQ